MAPARRQNTATGGIRADVTIISVTWDGEREVPRNRLPHSSAVMTVQVAALGNTIAVLPAPIPTRHVASAATVA